MQDNPRVRIFVRKVVCEEATSPQLESYFGMKMEALKKEVTEYFSNRPKVSKCVFQYLALTDASNSF